MIKRERDNVEWLEFELFSGIRWLKHGVFLRKGGVSPSPYDSLNLCFTVGDKPENVRQNLGKVAEILKASKIVNGKQVHGAAIKDYRPGQGAFLGECDALATQYPGIALKILHADCQAALFVDKKQRVVAGAHCGWRGSVRNIYRSTIQHLCGVYGSHPRDILVAISPSLGPKSAEFLHYKTELPEHFHTFRLKVCHFDFWSISIAQLTEEGIPQGQIQVAKIDTFTNPMDYFSHRRTPLRGANGTFVMVNR